MIHIYGRGVVGRRAEAMLGVSGVLAHDGRYRHGAQSGDVAILAHRGPQVGQAAEFLRHGVHVVAVGDNIDDVLALMRLGRLANDRQVGLVVGAATSPGLSGLLARLESQRLDVVDEIHVALHGTAGPACARTYHQSMRGRTNTWRDDKWVPFVASGGRELCWFPEPIGGKDCYSARSVEPALIHAAFPTVERITHRRSARRRDRLTGGLPMLSPPPPDGGIGGLRVELRGADADGARVTSIAGVAELVGTSSAAVAVAFANFIVAGRIGPGLRIPGEAGLPTLGLLHEVQRLGVRLQEFTGIPQR